MLTAKLLVSFGAPDQESAGDTFLPVQSQPLKTCSSAIFPPGLMSGLVTVIACAAPAPISAPIRIAGPTAIVRIASFLPKAPIKPALRRIRGYSNAPAPDASASALHKLPPSGFRSYRVRGYVIWRR
jgi:hypothetical protein